MGEKLAYSTDGVSQKKDPKKKESFVPSEGPCKMRLETKGRGGKSVTVLFNLPFDKAKGKKIMKDLQTILGCGGTLKNGMIEFRGDVRDDVEAIFQKNQMKIVRSGG